MTNITSNSTKTNTTITIVPTNDVSFLNDTTTTTTTTTKASPATTIPTTTTTTTIPPTTAPKPYCFGKSDGLYPDPDGKCDIYAVCANGYKYTLTCNGGDLFDTVSRSCQKADTVNCPGWKTHIYYTLLQTKRISKFHELALKINFLDFHLLFESLLFS